MEVSKITPEITLAVQAPQLRTPDDMNKSDLNARVVKRFSTASFG